MREKLSIAEKYLLTIDEAAEYFHIGTKAIRRLVREWPNETFYLTNGNRILIKRARFEEFLDEREAV